MTFGTHSSFGARCLTAGMVIAGFGLSLTAMAMPLTYGAATYLTARNCTLVTAADTCDGTGPGQRIYDGVIAGGASATTNLTHDFGGGATVFGSVEFGSLDLPILRASSTSAPTTRNNSNDTGYQSYTYNGTATVPFALTGTLDYTTSGSNGPLLGTGPGEGLAFDYLALWDPALVAGLSSASDILNNVFQFGCGPAGVIAVASEQYTGEAAGSYSHTLTLNRDCAGNDIFLSPGSQFVTVALLQIPTNRGGSLDASNTFAVALDPSLTSDAQATLTANLISARVSAVPEPATLAFVSLGLAVLGFSRRKQWPVQLTLSPFQYR